MQHVGLQSARLAQAQQKTAWVQFGGGPDRTKTTWSPGTTAKLGQLTKLHRVTQQSTASPLVAAAAKAATAKGKCVQGSVCKLIPSLFRVQALLNVHSVVAVHVGPTTAGSPGDVRSVVPIREFNGRGGWPDQDIMSRPLLHESIRPSEEREV